MSEDVILQMYGQTGGLDDQPSLNETGTGPEGTDFKEDAFCVKLALKGTRSLFME